MHVLFNINDFYANLVKETIIRKKLIKTELEGLINI